MNILKVFLFFLIYLNAFAQVSFTEEERKWIKNNPSIKVGVDSNWPPFEYVNNKKVYSGISSEYINLIKKETGLKFNIYSSDWTDIINKAKNKELDVLACAAKTNNRLKHFSFSQSYLDLDLLVVAKKNLSLSNFNEINKYKIVLQENNFIHDSLKEYFKNDVEFIFVTSNEEAFKLISYGEGDVFIGNLPVISHFIEKYLLTNLEIKFKANLLKTKISMAIQKENTILLNIINKVLTTIPEEKKEKINKKWIKTKYKKLSKNNLLSSEEKLWLNKQESIKIAGDPSWPPYSFYNEKGEYTGIVPDMIKEVFKNTNIKIEYVKTNTWNETLNLIEKKEVDMIDAISYTKKRAKFLNFTNKYLGADIVLISNNLHDKYVDSLKSIANKRIATVKGYSIINRIKNEHPYIKKIIKIDSPLKGLKSLSNSQIDYFLLDIPSFEFYSKKYGLSNLKIVGPSGYSYKYGFGILKDKKELLSLSNKLLDALPEDKRFKIYRNWVQIDYEEKIDYELVKRILFISFLLIFGTIYWNRKLQKEINHRQEIQKKLEISNNFNKAIMDSQVDIVVITTGKKISQANKAFFTFFNYKDLKEFKKDYLCISDSFAEINSFKYINKNENGKLWVDEVLENPNKIYKALIYKNEKAYIFKLSAAFVSKEKNLKTVVFTDITKLEDINELLLKAKNEALNVAKQKSEFLANMSHEIRTPMNSVIGFAELLDKEISNPIQRDYLDSIKKGGQSLLRIINDILDLSKIEAGKLEIKNEAINPSSLFREIESIFHSKIISKNINFEIEIDKSIPKSIILDGVRIRQILFNLIGNAIKFTQKGFIKLKVENVYKDERKSKIDLVFYVKDSGIGIEQESLKYIFNAFEQQKGQDNAKYGGTGLGLAICKKLVLMMNGKIEVTSKKAKGTCFKVSLFNIAVSSLSLETKKPTFDFKNIIFEKSTILVVDDIQENRKLVEASLKDYNFNLIMAQDGKDALIKLKTVKIDLILMDLRMPIMDGYETAVNIKNDKLLKTIPLIALTASVMGKDLEKVSEYGFDDYLRKPVILEDLIKSLSKFLEHSFNDNKTLEIKEKISFNEENLKNVLMQLKGSLKEEYIEIKDKGDFSLIEKFALSLRDLAQERSISYLEDYAKDLLSYIEAFDIEKVDYLLNTYEKLIKKLEIMKDEFV